MFLSRKRISAWILVLAMMLASIGCNAVETTVSTIETQPAGLSSTEVSHSNSSSVSGTSLYSKPGSSITSDTNRMTNAPTTLKNITDKSRGSVSVSSPRKSTTTVRRTTTTASKTSISKSTTTRPSSSLSDTSTVFKRWEELGNILILGDSYSTFKGYIPDGYSYWYVNPPENETDITSVEETWWKLLLGETKANLLRNDSYSGSTICNYGYGGSDTSLTGAGISFIARLDRLIEQGYFEQNQVDTIFIFGGTNDAWVPSPVGSVKYSGWTSTDLRNALPAFCYLLDRIKTYVPNARIINIINDGILNSTQLVNGYQNACTHYNVECLTLQNVAKQSGHPSVAGMQAIKDQLVAYLKTHVK